MLLLTVGACRPAVCPEGDAIPEADPLLPSTTAGYLRYAHAHNDYEQDRPLLDALDHGIHSVEADVWLHDDAVRVSHHGTQFTGTLAELYLDPLQEMVNVHGTVLSDGEPFTVWLDLKEGDAELREHLHELLAGYPMLTTFDATGGAVGPVTAVLTGHAGSKEAYAAEYDLRYAVRDSNDFSPDDPEADDRWQYYALKWGPYVQYGGDGDIDPGELDRLRCIVGTAHDLGREVRFYATPETEAFWGLAVAEGIDFIGTDDLSGLSTFLSGVD